MAKARSPAYPAIGLKEALEAVSRIYEQDYQNPIPREVAAKHMGYAGLNGKSLGALSALLKYGLLEGRGNDTRVSDRAVAIIAHPPGSAPRGEALIAAMSEPELFSELDQRFQNGKTSDLGIRAYLLTQKFIPSAADTALRSYRETKDLVNGETGLYNPDTNEAEATRAAAEAAAKKKPEIGDLVQVEINGAFQLPKPARLRAIREHEGVAWAFVEGSETGIPMEQVVVQSKGAPPPPPLGQPPRFAEDKPDLSPLGKSEREWLRGPLSKETSYRLIVSGVLGPKEIGKLIKMLEAQKSILSDEDDDEDS